MHYHCKSLSLATLLLSLTFPLSALQIELWITSPVLAQSLKAGKTEADKLIKQGEEFKDNNQPQAALKAYQQAVNIYREINDKKGAGKALIYIGNVYADDLDEYNQAITYYQKALEIAQSVNDTALEAKALNNLGLVYLHLGNTQTATQYCNKALEVAEKSKNYETQAIALKSLFAISFSPDNKSLDLLEQALVAIRQASGSAEDKLRQRQLEFTILEARGKFYYGIGLAKLMTKDPTGEDLLDKSFADYQQAVKVAQEIGDRTRQGRAYLGISDIYYSRNKHSKSIETLQQALQIFQSNKNSLSLVRVVYTKLGQVSQESGKKEQGIKFYQQAMQVIKTEPTHSLSQKLEQYIQQGFIALNIGNIYSDTSKFQKAVEAYKDALTILESAFKLAPQVNKVNKKFLDIQIKQGIKSSYLRMCFAYYTLGQYEEAKKACQAGKATSLDFSLSKSLSVDKLKSTRTAKNTEEIAKAQKKLKDELEDLEGARLLNNPGMEAYALANVAVAYADLGNYQQAELYFQQAIKLSETIEYSPFKPYIFFLYGEFYHQQKKYDLAMNFFQKSGDYAKQNGDKFAEANSFLQMGMTGFSANKLPEATKALYRAVDVFDSMREELSDKNYISIFETQVRTYTLLQKALISQNKFKEALEVAERGRARAFVNLLAIKADKNQTKINTPIPNIPALTIQDIQRIAQERKATIVEYSVLNIPNFNDEDEPAKNDSEIYIWVIKPTGEISFKQVNLKSLNTSLTDLVTEARGSICVGGRGINVEPICKSEQDIEIKKNNLKLQKLHQLLIEPISSFLPKNPEENVIFIPHNSLFLVPFAALQDKENKYLIENHTILTAPAIQVLDFTRQQRQKVTGKDILVMGNPTMPNLENFGLQLQPLPNAEKEAETIASFFQTKAITGKDATKAAFKQRLSSARIIHLATHGLLDDADKNIPSAIVFAPTSNDNKEALLTPGEIVDLSINAELVVLSACDTGRGKITGDGVIGLSRSLITAGASSLIVSLWSVPDAPTAELMTDFYQQWQKNIDKAVALRKAMLNTMKKHPHPVNWAGFTLIGESD